jgi:hypothetical protein
MACGNVIKISCTSMLCGRILNVWICTLQPEVFIFHSLHIWTNLFRARRSNVNITGIFFFMTWHSYWARATSLLRLHDHTQFDTPHSVGLLWTRDRPVAGDLYLTTHKNHKRQISMPPAGFEPAKARERPQTYWLNPVDNGVCITGTAQYEFQVRMQG